jgi:hypothetical protein
MTLNVPIFLIAYVHNNYCANETCQSIKAFIRHRSVPQYVQEVIDRDWLESTSWNVLLGVRGLLAHGVWNFVVQQKRWLVEYGLDPSRCPMAVPYKAKSVSCANNINVHYGSNSLVRISTDEHI